MPRIRSRAGLSGTLALAGVLVTLMSAPASAKVDVRWVDDDGKAGPTSCAGARTAYRKVQPAVTASGKGDIIKVCPGTYVGRVTISGGRDGLLIRAATSTAPVLLSPSSAPDSSAMVRVYHVDDVTLRNLKVRVRWRGSDTSCGVRYGVTASGAKDLLVDRVDIRPTGDGNACGLADGFRADAGTTGRVTRSVVKDFQGFGVLLQGGGTDMTIEHSSVVFAHTGRPDVKGNAGILVEYAAVGRVRYDTLKGPANGPNDPEQPLSGIYLLAAGAATAIRGNTVSRFDTGITVAEGDGGTIRDNTLTGGTYGIFLVGDDMSVYGNAASGNTGHGLFVKGPASGKTDANTAEQNQVHDNDFRGNGSTDCKGESSAVVTHANGNVFDANLGDESDPASLCDG